MGNQSDEVLDYAKTGGGDFLRNMGSKLGHQVAENPLPAALIGAGVIWLMMSDGKAHNGNFLLLGHDDLLGQSPDLRVATVAKHRKRHVDRTLMVRNHHRDKVRVDVAGRGGDARGQIGAPLNKTTRSLCASKDHPTRTTCLTRIAIRSAAQLMLPRYLRPILLARRKRARRPGPAIRRNQAGPARKVRRTRFASGHSI